MEKSVISCQRILLYELELEKIYEILKARPCDLEFLLAQFPIIDAEKVTSLLQRFTDEGFIKKAADNKWSWIIP